MGRKTVAVGIGRSIFSGEGFYEIGIERAITIGMGGGFRSIALVQSSFSITVKSVSNMRQIDHE